MRLAIMTLCGLGLITPAIAQEMPKIVGSLSFVSANAVDASQLLPPPPAPGSFQAGEELKTLHQIGHDASPAAITAAKSDAKNETVFLFAPAMGAAFDAQHDPATAALFAKIAVDADLFEKQAKNHWQRPRPFETDATLVPACGAGKKASYSYPSGHAVEAWTQGTVLAALVPARAQAIRARAAGFAYERLICGVHYPSDIEAGHVFGVALAQAILASPGFAQEAAAARAELARVGK